MSNLDMFVKDLTKELKEIIEDRLEDLNNEYQSQIDQLESDLSEANDQIEELKSEYEEELDSAKYQYERDLEDLYNYLEDLVKANPSLALTSKYGYVRNLALKFTGDSKEDQEAI